MAHLLSAKPRAELAKSRKTISVNLSQKAKSILSPYFGAKDFAPAYALA